MKQEPAKTPRSGVVGIPVVYGREDVNKHLLHLAVTGSGTNTTVQGTNTWLDADPA